MSSLDETMNRGDLSRCGFAATNCAACTVFKHALERQHPWPHRSMSERVWSGRVGSGHSTDSAELAARRIDGISQAHGSRMAIQLTAQHSDLDTHRSCRRIRLGESAKPAEVEHHTIADCTTRHAAPRSARDDRESLVARPPHDHRDVVFVSRDCYRARLHACYSSGFGINGASLLVGSEVTGEAGGRTI